MMKRSFVAAVAVASLATGSAHAAEKIKLNVGGFLHSAFTVQSVTDSKLEDRTALRQDGRFAIEGSTVLDNGLKVGAVASVNFLSGNEGESELYGRRLTAEELYATVGGSFGDVSVGQRRNAASLLHVFIPSAGLGNIGVDDARITTFVGGITTTAVSLNLVSEYAARVQYFTPRIAGLQLGASFASEAGGPNILGVGNMGGSDSDHSGAFSMKNSSFENEITVAANYSQEFSGVGVNASAGYSRADSNPYIAPSFNREDPWGLQAGLSVSYMGFTLGGAYGFLDNQEQRPAGDTDQRYGVGLNYKTGPWTYGASWLRRDIDAGAAFVAATGADKQDFFEVGTSYELGAGVTTGIGYYYNANYAAVPGTVAPDSHAAAVSLGLSF